MFHGTITQNMRLNNCMATDQMLAVAAEKAGILQDILRLPEGFDAPWRQVHEPFSAGFYALAVYCPGFCCNAEVVLFDEPAPPGRRKRYAFHAPAEPAQGQHTIVMVSPQAQPHKGWLTRRCCWKTGPVKYAGSPDKAIEILMVKR